MTPQHLGDVFHRFDVASHRAETPALEEFLCPGGVGVVPEALEVLHQEVGFDGPQVHRQEFGQLQSRCVGEVLLPLQEAPAALAQDWIFALCFDASPGFSGTLVEGLGKVLA